MARGIKNLLLFIALMTGLLCVVSVRHLRLDYGLTDAAFRGDNAAVRSRLDAGANVNNTVLEGLSPVRAAVSHDHYRITKLLLSRGADPNAALKQSLGRENGQMVTLCLDYGANAFAKPDAEHAAPFDKATPQMKKVIRDYYAQKQARLPNEAQKSAKKASPVRNRVLAKSKQRRRFIRLPRC